MSYRRLIPNSQQHKIPVKVLNTLQEIKNLPNPSFKTQTPSFLATNLIKSYFQKGLIKEAHTLFDEMSERDVVSWTAMISGYASCKYYSNAWNVFFKMLRECDDPPNAFTLSSVLKVCKGMHSLSCGALVHGLALKHGLDGFCYVDNCLLDMYATCCSKMDAACTVFRDMEVKVPVSWTILITGYTHRGDGHGALKVYRQMLMERVETSPFSISIAVRACTSVGSSTCGMQMHTAVLKCGFDSNIPALHDGKDVYFLLQVGGDYAYYEGDNSKCPSVALMFQVGDSASYHNMGGCKESPQTCTSKSCRGYEVDIMHFSLGNAIPGRLYGGNPVDNKKGNGGDSFGHLVDLYAWNPHCRNLDGIKSGNDSGAQNDWKGAWWHSSLTTHTGFTEEDTPYGSSGQKGTYYFEFSRPLRTMDRFQQDVQFTIGQPSKFSAAFWYPVDGNPWHGSAHYSVGCDWVPLDMTPGSSAQTKVASRNSSNVVSAFALILSVIAICVSVFIGYTMTRNNNTVPFIPMDRL